VIDDDARPALAATRSEILRLLKRSGELGIDELASSLAMTASGMRQQLRLLAADGYVANREQRGATGRPKHLYRLTPAADRMFPRRYGELVGDLLAVASEDDPAFIERMFAKRGARRLADAQARLHGPLSQRVRELAAILDQDGYLAEVEPLDDVAPTDDALRSGWRIVERNCAIFDVALRYGHACSSELEFLRAALPDARVERVRHMVAGETHCAYEIRPA
jgi:DeoR family suf operon transcriptional repressor